VVATGGGQILKYVDLGVTVAGGLLFAVWFSVVLVRRRDPLAAAPAAATDMVPAVPVVCMLGYLSGAIIAEWAVDRFVRPGFPDPLGERLVQITASAFAALTGGAACVVCATWTFREGLWGFGLRWGGVGRDAVSALAGLLTAFPICNGLLYLSSSVIRWWTGDAELPGHPVLEALADPALPGWGRFVALVGPLALAPVAEELFFRGIVQSCARRYLGRRWGAILVSSVMFGLAHYSQPQVVVPLAALGAILGYLYERRGSLIAPVLLHVLFNLRTLVWQYAEAQVLSR